MLAGVVDQGYVAMRLLCAEFFFLSPVGEHSLHATLHRPFGTSSTLGYGGAKFAHVVRLPHERASESQAGTDDFEESQVE